MKIKNLIWIFLTMTIINFVYKKTKNENVKNIFSLMNDSNKKFWSAFYIWLIIWLISIFFIILLFLLWTFWFSAFFNSFPTFVIYLILWIIILVGWIYVLTRYSFALHNLIIFWDKWMDAINKSILQVKWNWWKVFLVSFVKYFIPILVIFLVNLYVNNIIILIIVDIFLDFYDVFFSIILTFLFIDILTIKEKLNKETTILS